jgi:hypothetical protein
MMLRNSEELETTIMDAAYVAHDLIVATDMLGEQRSVREPALQPSDEKLLQARAAAQLMSKLLGSLTGFERDVLGDIVRTAGEMARRGLAQQSIRNRVRSELLALIETVKEMTADDLSAGATDLSTQGELESLDGESAIAWIEVTPGLRVKTEMAAEPFVGVNLNPGDSFVIEPRGAKARIVKGGRRLLSAAEADSLARSLIEKEAAYRETAETQQWRFAEDEG